MTPEQIELVILHFGFSKQVYKSIEELSELQKELCKALLNDLPLNKVPTKSIVDELADVEIMCEQLRHIFRISEQVDDRKSFKVDRLMKRIELNY